MIDDPKKRRRKKPKPETTPLPPERSGEFDAWLRKNSVSDLDSPDSHYDYRGAFAAGVDRDQANGHWPDTYKQHGHPTFSVESKYSTGPDDGGTWNGDSFVPTSPKKRRKMSMDEDLEKFEAAQKPEKKSIDDDLADHDRAQGHRSMDDDLADFEKGSHKDSGDVELKPHGEVTVSPVKGVGFTAEDIAKAASSGSLKERIAANLQIARNPELAAKVQPIAKRLQAPGALHTAVNIATSNLISPISDRAAEGATEHNIEEYTGGGGDASKHATLFGAAAAAGALAGNLGLGAAARTAGEAGRAGSAVEELPKTRVGRVLHGAKESAKVNAAVGGGSTAVLGDEEGHRDVGAIAKSAIKQGAYGAASGALLGGVSEGVASLAKRRAKPPSKGVQGAAAATKEAAPEAVKSGTRYATEGDDGVEYRHSGIGLVPKIRQMISESYRGAVVTPYAKIEKEAPELVDALHTAGASRAAAQHIADRRVGWVTEGLSREQKDLFGKQLVHDNLLAEAERKAASDPEAASRFLSHAEQLESEIPEGTSDAQWFKDALARHKQYVEPVLDEAAIGSGVSPESMRKPTSGYVKLVSEDRLANREIRRAMDAAQVAEPGDLKPRGKIDRAIRGENPALERLFPAGAKDLREGPLNPKLPQVGGDRTLGRPGSSRTGSAQTAQGTAREYVTDYDRIVREDANDKIVRSAKNAVYDEIGKVGRSLKADEEPALGKKVVERTVLGPDGQPKLERWEVSPRVAFAVRKFEEKSGLTDESGPWRRFTSAATKLQISGMPVEATSHMNSLASIVASVPGEKDVVGKAAATIPGAGAKLAAIREMTGIDFSSAETRALESRLADIGALRIDDERGGVINSAHRALFGPEGVDVRGRLVLARKYLDRKPDASDRELREFIVGKLGNYVRANSGNAVNALQDAGISAFARFQAARIPSSVRSTFGASGLPSSNAKEQLGTIANTLYRGPVGYAIAGEAANRAMTGHSMADNERGHQTDVQLPFAVGPHGRPVYLPLAFTNPVLATGLRATGARDALPLPGSPNAGGKVADAARDVENTALGVLSPAVRAASIAATGRTPYLRDDGSMLRVSDPKFSKSAQVRNNLRSAVSLANPAMSAFAEHGGDVGGNSLADALSEDGRRFGGPKAAAARVAEFVAPRVATVGVGGTDAETSEIHRNERDYSDVINSYKARLRRSPGPKHQDEIIEDAVRDAERDGRFDPDAVRADLEKYADRSESKVERQRESRDRGFERKKMK